MNTNVLNHLSRSFERSWRIWLLGTLAAAIAIEAGYHHFGFDGPGPAVEAPDFAVSQPLQTTLVTLTPAQIAAGGIAVEPISEQPLAEIFRAPGEVRVNEYSASNVSSRLSATVISRQARLGDRIRRGQPLTTLYSAAMAEAQSAFILASRNYVRMSNLKEYVSGQLFDEADVKRQETRGRLETFGLSVAEINELASTGLMNRPAGQFDLVAPQDGMITTDAFRAGEVVEPGKTLYEIANLSNVWVEAQVSPALASRIKSDRARVYVQGQPREARVIQTRALLDEATRTAGVRLQLDNANGALKPGEFVDVELFGEAQPALTVPTAAVLRDADGSWIVYIEKLPGTFEPAHIQVVRAAGDETAISGIPPGTRVVTMGAFFVKSEADKSSFGEEE